MRLLLQVLSVLALATVFSSSTVTASPPAKSESGESIKTALARVTGVFKDPSSPDALKYKGKGLEKTVIMTGCNFGFLNHLHNFNCFMDRLGYKFLVVALDHKTHEYLKRNTTMESIYMQAADGVATDSASFRSAQFNLITARKKEAVHDVLEMGYDVLFSDTDVALVRDPFSYLLWDNVDYVHSLNQVCEKKDHWTFRHHPKEEGNTGFYYVRSNRRTISLWRTAYESIPKFPGLDDQAVFWRVIRASTDPPIVPIGTCSHYNDDAEKKFDIEPPNDLVPLVTCVLDPCVFSAGMLSRVWVPEYTYEELLENVALRNETICAVHANYLSGNSPKMQRMQEYGFWLATKSGTVVHQSAHLSHAGHKQHHKHHHETDSWSGECLPYVFHHGSELALDGGEDEVRRKRRRMQLRTNLIR